MITGRDFDQETLDQMSRVSKKIGPAYTDIWSLICMISENEKDRAVFEIKRIFKGLEHGLINEETRYELVHQHRLTQNKYMITMQELLEARDVIRSMLEEAKGYSLRFPAMTSAEHWQKKWGHDV